MTTQDAFVVLQEKTKAFNDSIREFSALYDGSLDLSGWICDNDDTLFDIENELEYEEE
jgi:hypothetical protein